MTWFRVDDDFYDHPKFDGVSNAAVGLWVKAGAWCGRHLTDGVISAAQIRRLKGTPAQVRALVEAGLWDRFESDLVRNRNESEPKVYRFHDWNDFNPTRNQKKIERAAGAERQRKSRERKRLEQQERENVTRDSPRDSGPLSRCDSHVTGPHLSQRPDPTRPDPVMVTAGLEPSGRRAAGVPELAEDTPGLDAGERAAVAAAHREGLPEAAIEAGIVAYQLKPQPKGGGLLMTMIRETAAEQRKQSDAEFRRAERRAAIEGCDRCDERGMATLPDGRAYRCDHSNIPVEQQEQPRFEEQSDPEFRRKLLDELAIRREKREEGSTSDENVPDRQSHRDGVERRREAPSGPF